MMEPVPPIPAIQWLQQWPQWVCYPHISKLPLDPHTGKGADCNDPATWGTYDLARRTWASRRSWYAGLGFEFVKAQGISGVDLDKCVVDGEISRYACEVLALLNSYAEFSPSGTGIHILVKGSLPDNLEADKKGDGDQCVEMYDHQRYFSVTGKQVPGTPNTIEERQEELLLLYNETVERRRIAKAERPRQNFNREPSILAGPDSAYGMAALDKECAEVATTPAGSRNEQLNKSAFVLGQLVGGGELSRTTVERELTAAAALAGLGAREIEKTIESGLEAGMEEPRSKPVLRTLPDQDKQDSQQQDTHTQQQTAPIDADVIENALTNGDIDALIRAMPLLAQLSKRDYLSYEHRIKSTFDKKLNMNSFNSAIAEARKAIAPQPRRQGDDGNVEYERTETGMVYHCAKYDDPVWISNFPAEIVADITTDDGAEQTRSYEIAARVAHRHFTFEVPAKEFSKCDWVDECLGARARVTTGPSMKSHLVNAMKYCSNPDERFHYAHTGWRKIGGEMVYLHNDGCLSQVSQVPSSPKPHLTQKNPKNESAWQANGERERERISQVSQVSHVYSSICVKLSGPLAKYVLPTGAQQNIAHAVRQSLRFLELMEDTITMPLYSSLWRSVLPDVDFGVHLAGQSGQGKTEMVALLQQHFGPEMDARRLPGSWESTENSLEMLLFQAKDTIVVIDDFKPKGGKLDQDRLHAKADRVFRQIGNGAARGRLTSNLEQRAERRPRCLLISTGEDVPRGQSLKARGVVLTMTGSVTTGAASRRLAEAQKDARAGLYAQAMAGYIAWLAPHIETVQDELLDLVASERDALRIAGHARSGTNTANMLVGMKFFLRFAIDCGAITEEEARKYLERCMHALRHIADMANRENQQEKPSEQWRRLIIAAIANKSAHLVSADGDYPGPGYGWIKSVRSVEVNGELVSEETFRGGGPQIGWIDGEDIYLNPIAAYKVSRAMGSATGDDITTVETTLRKFLAQDKLLASTDLDKKRGTITVRKRLENSQRDVLHLKVGTLYPNDPPVYIHDSVDIPDSERPESASEDGSGVSQVFDSETIESSQVDDSARPDDSDRYAGTDYSWTEIKELMVALDHYAQKCEKEERKLFWSMPELTYANGHVLPTVFYARMEECIKSRKTILVVAALERIHQLLKR